jgi:organic hydroperoxide reductase OsmC/OhrA
LLSAYIAPFAVIFGPITHDEEEPPSLWPEVLLTAALLSLFITTLSVVLRRRKATPPS